MSSLRGSVVAADGRSPASRDSESSGFLRLATKLWIENAETATSEPRNRATASSPYFDQLPWGRAATLGMPGSPGSGEIVLRSRSGAPRPSSESA